MVIVHYIFCAMIKAIRQLWSLKSAKILTAVYCVMINADLIKFMQH